MSSVSPVSQTIGTCKQEVAKNIKKAHSDRSNAITCLEKEFYSEPPDGTVACCLASAKIRVGQYEEALDLYALARKIFVENGEDERLAVKGMVRALTAMGKMELHANQQEQASVNFRQANELKQEMGIEERLEETLTDKDKETATQFKRAINECYRDSAMTQLKNGNYPAARRLLKTVIAYHLWLGERTSCIELYKELGVCYRGMLDFDNAVKAFLEMLAISQESNQKEQIAAACTHLGEIASMRDDPVCAINWLHEALANSDGNNGMAYARLSNAYNEASDAYNEDGDFDSAEKYFKKVLEVAKTHLDDDDLQIECMALRARFFYSNENYLSALSGYMLVEKKAKEKEKWGSVFSAIIARIKCEVMLDKDPVETIPLLLLCSCKLSFNDYVMPCLRLAEFLFEKKKWKDVCSLLMCLTRQFSVIEEFYCHANRRDKKQLFFALFWRMSLLCQQALIENNEDAEALAYSEHCRQAFSRIINNKAVKNPFSEPSFLKEKEMLQLAKKEKAVYFFQTYHKGSLYTWCVDGAKRSERILNKTILSPKVFKCLHDPDLVERLRGDQSGLSKKDKDALAKMANEMMISLINKASKTKRYLLIPAPNLFEISSVLFFYAVPKGCEAHVAPSFLWYQNQQPTGQMI